MDPKTVTLITSILQLAVATEPLVFSEILKVKSMLSQSPNVEANLKQIFDNTNAADDDTLNTINEWLVEKGFEPLPQ